MYAELARLEIARSTDKKPCDNKNDVEMGTVHQTPNGSYMIPPQPYIRPAVKNHLDECKAIIEAYLNQN